MDNYEEKKYTVDEIIDDIVRLEDMDTEEFIEEDRKLLPSNIKDGSIIIYDMEGYHMFIAQIQEENEKRNNLRERLERLKALKKDE